MKTIRFIGMISVLLWLGMAHAEKVNINTAAADDIAEALIGVGPAKAQAIVEYRKANGNFKSVNDLEKVKGIGAATLKKNIENIVLSMKARDRK